MGKHGKPCFYCGALACHQKYKLRVKVYPESIDCADDMNPVDGFICPECKEAFRVSRLESECGYIIDWKTEWEFAPRFCPNCGYELSDVNDLEAVKQ